MMKSIGTVQLALATVFVVPAVTGQDENVNSLQSQLSATLNSLDYLAELRDRAANGDRAAIGAIVSTTEAPRDPQRAGGSYLESLQTDLARLRFQLDRLLGTPSEVKAIMQLPGSVVRSLGLAGAAGEQISTGTDPKAAGNGTSGSATGVRTPSAGPLGLAGSEGMSPAMLQQINSELLPLDSVTDSARRRGAESVALEGADYVAAPTRLGRLYVRRGRAAEAVTVLESAPKSPARTYWLARAYQSLERYEDAADLYRSLIADPDAADFHRQAERDLKFVDFSRELRNSGGTSR
jgi:tetratricopeptide (TPR) repeat protein